MRLSNKQKAVIALIVASVIWGAASPIMKLTLKEVPAFSLAVIRFAGASLILFPFVAKRLSLRRRDLFPIALCGVFGISIHIALFFFGLTYTTALNAGMLITTTPLFTLLLAKIFLKEKLSPYLLLGGFLGFLGIVMVIGKDAFVKGLSVAPFGDILILLSMLSFVTYEILSKKLFKVYDPLVITFYSFLIGWSVLVPGVYFEYVQNPSWFTSVSPISMGGILYGILFSSVIAYSFWQWGLSQIPASRVGFFLYLDPVVSTVVAVYLIGEVITFSFIFGAILIFAGLFLAEGTFPYHPHRYRKHFLSKS